MEGKELNRFWLVRYSDGFDDMALFNRKPTRFGNSYTGKRYWNSSYHGCCFLNKKSVDLFSDISWEDEPIECRLVIDNDNPMFWLERYNDCLFIDSKLISYIRCYDGESFKRTRHYNRISNKLFPEISMESGLVGVRIEVINK